ncbi:30S ribosome-binding factor RbfA [Candidatus Parabeggiatoa sp. HSG14]|uniref:30S ribosome-binding factor RbfA n=1 Tax=Candidatus Parabeggiatoa sp. HSG14 TaxID=3055593 RepID=UPI0025A6AE1B|nr:30S ribosome-binding factor RbfA [Thiotrichales bacterium HSG14]
MKEFSRTQRINEQIQRDLADIIRREINVPSLGMVTVSSVEVSTDLKYARVYVTVLGGTSYHETVKYLNNCTGRIRHHLSKRLTTRVTPSLQFLYDGSIEYGSRLSALIDSVLSEQNKK